MELCEALDTKEYQGRGYDKASGSSHSYEMVSENIANYTGAFYQEYAFDIQNNTLDGPSCGRSTSLQVFATCKLHRLLRPTLCHLCSSPNSSAETNFEDPRSQGVLQNVPTVLLLVPGHELQFQFSLSLGDPLTERFLEPGSSTAPS